MWKALAVSSNVIAASLIDRVGVGSVISVARDLGITTPLQNDLTISLGSNGVKLYDMVVAYGAFANGGFRVRPYAVERVENSRGVVIYEAMPTKVIKVISYDTAAGMTYMLKKVVEVGTGRGAAVGREIAGKTGTTDDYRDAWFMGYSPDVVAGVWLGNDDNSRLPGITGGGLPARIWGNFMKTALSDYPESVFDYPDFTNKPQSINSEVIYVEDENSTSGDNNSIIIDEDVADGFSDNENSFDDTFMENKNERSGKKQNAEPVRAPMPIIIDKQNNEAPKSRLKVKPMLPFDSSTKPSQTGNAPLPGM